MTIIFLLLFVFVFFLAVGWLVGLVFSFIFLFLPPKLNFSLWPHLYSGWGSSVVEFNPPGKDI